MMKNISIIASITEHAIQLAEIREQESDQVIQRTHFYPFNAWLPADKLFRQWTDAVLEFSNGAAIRLLIIAIPGPFDYQNGVSYIHKNRHLHTSYGISLRNIFSLGCEIPENVIFFFNDAACALAAETCGQDLSDQTILGIFIDHGFGAAWQVREEITDANLWGADFLAGKVDDYLSLRWFKTAYFNRVGLNLNVHQLNRCPTPTTRTLWNEFVFMLADYVKEISQTKKFDTLVISGSLGTTKPDIVDKLRRKLQRHNCNINIRKASLKRDVQLIGAFELYKKRYH